ncbi:MAG: prepilin-type N-terminal cleavage/methylation domain-containing protein [Candidatus Eremiobacteraeota bacterium]|nr:prepilin-type N-terminal cleavage/methylation domain-containing protein [Candidatus Eremiobacteraeota bacterium]
MGRFSDKAFTLIEFMIAIAILAIVASIAVNSLFQLRGVTRDRDYADSLQQAPAHLLALRKEKFSNLPPEVAAVSAEGKVQLRQRDILAGSVKAYSADGSKELEVGEVDLQTGLVSLKGATSGKAIIYYSYFLPHQGEAHYLEADGSVKLEHWPVRSVKSVALAQGDKLQPAASFKLGEGGKLNVSGGKPGQLVVVDYHGGENGLTVSGRFLDSKLDPVQTVTGTKLLEVGESYNGPFRASLPLIKVSDE